MNSKPRPLEELPLYSQMMWWFFAASFSDNDENFNQGLTILKSGKINVFDYDNQIFRELRCGRWMAPKCRVICNEIMKLTNMTMEDIRVHISNIYHIPTWSEDRWAEYENCDCEGVCMKSH
jgi:hypothetical protein